MQDPAVRRGDATPAVLGVLFGFVVPGSLLIAFGWRSHIRRFQKTLTRNSGDWAGIPKPTISGAISGAQTTQADPPARSEELDGVSDGQEQPAATNSGTSTTLSGPPVESLAQDVVISLSEGEFDALIEPMYKSIADVRRTLKRYDPAAGPALGIGSRGVVFTIVAQLFPLDNLDRISEIDRQLGQGGRLAGGFQAIDGVIRKLCRENPGIFMAGVFERVLELLRELIAALDEADLALARLRRARPMGTTDQETTTLDILEFLAVFGTNVKQLVGGLEDNDPSKVRATLAAIVAQDLGARLMAIFDLSVPGCLERLADPLKRIESDLSRAEAFVGQATSPTLPFVVPGNLAVIRNVLGRRQKTVGGTGLENQ